MGGAGWGGVPAGQSGYGGAWTGHMNYPEGLGGPSSGRGKRGAGRTPIPPPICPLAIPNSDPNPMRRREEEEEEAGTSPPSPIFRDIRRYYCDYCGICRSKKSLISSHIQSQHKDEIKDKEKECDDERPRSYDCKECGASFKKPAYLKQHIQSHSLVG